MNPRSPKEIQAVMRLDAQGRFDHFVKRVVDFEESWGLWNEGWAVMADNEDTPVFPLWPAREYAEMNRVGDWSEYEPRPISLDELKNEFLPSFTARGIKPGIFPLPEGKGVMVTADELEAALRQAELESYG